MHLPSSISRLHSKLQFKYHIQSCSYLRPCACSPLCFWLLWRYFNVNFPFLPWLGFQFFFSRKLYSLWLISNKTLYLPIRSVIILVKSNWTATVRSTRFCYHSYDNRLNWTPLSPITITYLFAGVWWRGDFAWWQQQELKVISQYFLNPRSILKGYSSSSFLTRLYAPGDPTGRQRVLSFHFRFCAEMLRQFLQKGH